MIHRVWMIWVLLSVTMIPALGETPAPVSASSKFENFGIHVLSADVVVINSQPFSANSLLVKTKSNEIILVDSPTTPADTTSLLEWTLDRWGSIPKYAITSHWHADASGGNQVLIDAGVEVIASKKTTEILLDRGDAGKQTLLEMFKEQPETFQKIEALVTTPATISVEIQGQLMMTLGGESVVLLYPGPSHSSDSIGIYFPDRKLLYGGCTVRSNGKIINKNEADAEGWVHALQVFMQLELTHVIPGHGARFEPEILAESLTAARALKE